MLTRDHICRYHAFVPVWYWPVLWLSLLWLTATLRRLGAEGRDTFLIRVCQDGRIFIDHVSESPAERTARGALPDGPVHAPWTRLAALGDTALWALLTCGPSNRTACRPLPDRGWTVSGPAPEHPRAPP